LHPWKAGKLETVINFSLIASALLLLGALIYSPVKQAEKLEADLRKIRPAVDEAQTAKKHLQQLMTALTILNVQAQRPNALSILSTMTKLFPDSAWIYDFQLQGDEVRIAGFATDPSSLIGIINGEPHFREAKFLSPVITTNGMGQRFNLSFHVKVGDTK
jgi:general secretion pathway protein L